MAQRKLNSSDLKAELYRRRFVVPNMVTVCNLFCGFLTIIYASSGRFEKAIIAITFAIILDGLDGRVARRLNATSSFGVEFDSFSDLVSFGVAPAILLYQWCFLQLADEFGVFVCFIYIICAASRLARFNIAGASIPGFQGLPMPGAGGMVAAFVFALEPYAPSEVMLVLGAVLTLGLSFLMVSRLPFFSIKRLQIKDIHPLIRVGAGSLVAVIWYAPRVGLFVLAASYSLSGPFTWWYRRKKKTVTLEQGAA